jgi:hypothetical protein
MERAIIKGELSEDIIRYKLSTASFSELKGYEVDFLIDMIKDESGKSAVTDADILEYRKSIKSLHFKELCEKKIVEGFTASNGHFYRTNRDDQTNMIGQKDELNVDESITVVPWKTEDAGYIDHTRLEWLAIYNEAFYHKKTQLFKYNDIKNNVLACVSHEEIDLIEWI